MLLSEFCNFFDFELEVGNFEDEDCQYKYRAKDMQGVFVARYGNKPDDFIDQFESMEDDYIWEWFWEQDDFPDDKLLSYKEAYDWAVAKYGKENVSGYLFDIVKVFAGVDKLEVE